MWDWLRFLEHWQLFLPVGIIGGISWSVWLIRKVMSAGYRPLVNDFRTTTSVVVPSFREDPDVLLRCLDTWLAQGPTEVIIVLDVEDLEARDRLMARQDRRIHVMMFAHEGKRSALGVGIRAARYEVLVLTDSDTAWEPGLLDAVQMPFANPKVGAVGTRQNVFEPRSSVWRRVADWIIDLRYMDYVPATARRGGVVCVSGRTAAYRRSAVMPVQGYRTEHQDSARALSMFPSTFKAFCKQRVRWSRNSYRCYLTSIYKGWLWRVPLISQLTVFQILFTPVTMFATVYYLVAAWFSPQRELAVILGLAWLFIGRAIRSFSHLRRRPSDIIILPLVTFVIMFVALPIKTWAFVTMNKQGWLTRHADLVGGEGQDEASLTEDTRGAA
jgi:cellulose synthase/poly-beta-1,6-N-acetylglucosamine synthase-like glycosyltransferase